MAVNFIHQMSMKYLYQHLPLQGPPKCTQIAIFVYTIPSGNPGRSWLQRREQSLQICMYVLCNFGLLRWLRPRFALNIEWIVQRRVLLREKNSLGLLHFRVTRCVGEKVAQAGFCQNKNRTFTAEICDILFF
jgi:hypothetical protein